MEKPKEDIYIQMLRYGKSKLDVETGFRIYELVEFLKENGYPNFSVHQIILHQYFLKIYFSDEKEEKYNPSSSDFYYLQPEKYLALLEYDSIIAARKEAKFARNIAVASILLTLIISIITFFK